MKQLNLKVLLIFMVIIISVLTIYVCSAKPVLHKPFQINIIKYLMQIHPDGSVSTQKSTTTTVVKEK